MIGRGLLPSAQLAHGIGVLVADAVRRAEKEAQRDAQAAKRKAARQGLAAGPNGPREAVGKAAADLVWARLALLADLPEARPALLAAQVQLCSPTGAGPEKSGMDQEEIYNLDENAEYDSADGSECSESELSVPAANV